MLTEVGNAPDGTYGAGADSRTMVVPAYRVGIVLNVKDDRIMRGVDGVRVSLTEKDILICQTAKEWTSWKANPQDLKLKKRKDDKDDTKTSAKHAKPAVVLIDDDKDDKDEADEGPGPASKKPKLDSGKVTFKILARNAGFLGGLPFQYFIYIYIYVFMIFS